MEQDGRIIPDEDQEFLKNLETRIAGGQLSSAPSQKILVDVREFRATLTNVLHLHNFQIVPCTLETGDYILTPDICVERKSISDLISSFKSGRLYSQCESMSLHYKTPCLLIEFHEGKAFSLPQPSLILNLNDLQAKIVLLTIAFPKLLVIWSSSPVETSLIFKELKSKQPDPPDIPMRDDLFTGSMVSLL